MKVRTLQHIILIAFGAFLAVPGPGWTEEKDWLKLSPDLGAWKGPTGEWLVTDKVEVDAGNPKKLSAQLARGDILVNGPGRAHDLISKQAFGDVEVHVEFLIAKGSNSGVKLMSVYEIQIFDSFGARELTGNDCGGIYPRAELKPKYHHIDKGTPPKVNAARPAGEWQTLDIAFTAPRFDAAGKKVGDACFVKVVLNGQVIHENAGVKYPTGHNWSKPEVAQAPLLLQGDHGPVAFRNVRVRPLGLAAPIDFTQPQSPPLSTPEWVKIIDQGTLDPRLKGYFTPEGLKLEIVAENPTVINPVGMTFATDGTPYVLEWLPNPPPGLPLRAETITYKDGSTRQIFVVKKRFKDVVKVLRDSKGKGIYDMAKVVLEDEVPSGILLHDGWLYLSGQGTIRRYKQSKPGGPYDVKERIAQGFDAFQTSGMTLGNDGWLYASAGTGDNIVEGSDGSRATVLRTGAVFRCRPDGSKMQSFAIGFYDPGREVVVDEGGNLFQADTDAMGCRLMHVVEGADFGWRLLPRTRDLLDSFHSAIMGELPGKLPPLLRSGRGSAVGLLIYNDSRLPENYRGLLLSPDPERQVVRAYRVVPRGATFAGSEQFELLKSADPLFRPCQVALGPDGAIFIVDKRTKGEADGKRGRIYRLSWGGTKDQPALPLRGLDSWEKITKLGDEDLLKALASEDGSDRIQAQRELVKRGPGSRAVLLKMLPNDDLTDSTRVAALGVLNSFWDAGVQKACFDILEAGTPNLRRLAVDAIGLNSAAGDMEAQNTLLKFLGDNDPTVRRAIAMAMGRIGAPGSADALANAIAFEDSKDPFLRDGLVRGLEMLGKLGMERLVALGSSGVDKDLDRVVDTFAMLRTPAAAEMVPVLLKNPHLSIAQRAELIRSYRNFLFDPPVSLEAVLQYLVSQPGEAVPVKLAGLEVLSSGGAFQKEKAATWLLTVLEEKDADLRLAAIKAVEEGQVSRAAEVLALQLKEPGRSDKEREAITKALRVIRKADMRK